MPVSLDPNARFDVVLISDQGKDSPPTFVFKHRSFRQARDWAAKVDAATESKDNQRVDALEGAVEAFLVGWHDIVEPDGLHIPYGEEGSHIGDFLTASEIWELWMALNYERSVTDEDLGKLDSPSPSSTEPSAGDAEAAAEKKTEPEGTSEKTA